MRIAGAKPRPENQRARRLIAIAATIAVLVTGSIVAAPADDAAFAKVKYPTWSDVTRARKSEAATRAEVKHINQLLSSLSATVKKTEAASKLTGQAYQEADQAFFIADSTATNLQKQADAAKKTAQQSAQQVGQIVAQMARGGGDFSVNLWLSGSDASNVLTSVGQASKYSQQTNDLYEQAVQSKNAAQSLTDQADVAKGVRETAKAAAEVAFQKAQVAAEKAQAAYEENKTQSVKLAGLLKVLTAKRKVTEKKYLHGLKMQYGAGASVGAGAVSSSGWAKPANGYISSGFGWRVAPIPGVLPFHSGTDIAGGCGVPIYAAHSGTVVYAGWYGTYGNFILLDNGLSIQTGYAHIVNGGILVRVGQHVAVGQNIARTGMTGAATGCHLHFEVRINGVAVDSVPFMRNRGITIG
ncbi:MAG: hypothetical protein QOI02_527 [Actinomycetota bacterium]|nr:peptidoglycan DD-metalloendopeptidase family protein [Glaciihabitans sp.]MDQ1555525.1 hypothetical protein [Actinomycetota bacterium]